MAVNITTVRRGVVEGFYEHIQEAIKCLETLEYKDRLYYYQQLAEFASIQLRGLHEKPEV